MFHQQRFMDKLWFSSKSGNWELASFYLHELEENTEGLIEEQHIEEGQNISHLARQLLVPALQEVEKSVRQQDSVVFKDAYQLVVNRCNQCHIATNHSFIKIKTPTRPAFSNQVY